MKKNLAKFMLVIAITAAFLTLFENAFAADAMSVVRSVKSFYFKANSDFIVSFKVNSKMRDIAFDGNFMFRPPMNFIIDAVSSALQVKIVFKEADGFIYLPAANMITNLDKMTQLKTKSIQIPKNMAQLDSKLDQLAADFELDASDEPGDVIKISGKSKKAKGAFSALVDKKSFELKSIATFTAKGAEEMFIEFKNYRKEKVSEALFERPTGAIEANLPVPVF
ncbi:MAG TPA: hypothetical protein PKK26_01945 [Candidatus Wallbacteria bacterium]|nr:hypothetical protein [Candidatus Wallbacteria bacterium]